MSWKSEKKLFDSFFKQFLTNQGKNKDEKNWENEFDFWIIHVKVRLYGNFHENLVKKIFDTFFREFLTNQGKNEDEDDKILGIVFNFWILYIKIRICGNFHGNWSKRFLTHFLRHFWLIKAKMKMKMKIFWRLSLIFELSIPN